MHCRCIVKARYYYIYLINFCSDPALKRLFAVTDNYADNWKSREPFVLVKRK
jgi:hypothetical protein